MKTDLSRMTLLEPLESRMLMSVEPSGREQLALELLNRARMNPAAELPLVEQYAHLRGQAVTASRPHPPAELALR